METIQNLNISVCLSGIPRVYTMGRAFRAEKNQSSTHLSEFTMLEAEISFMEDLDDLLSLTEEYLKSAAECIYSNENLPYRTSLGQLGDTNEEVVQMVRSDKEYPRISYDKAVEIAREKGIPIAANGGLTRAAELEVVSYCKSPVFVTNFPVECKPFYMKRTECGKKTESFDLLCPLVGELAGGSLRVISSDDLQQSSPLHSNQLEWYSQLRKRGKPPSGGFGIGFERLLQLLLGVKNIKDTVPFPRWFRHCSC